jgi:hypothetical protein
MTQIVGGICFTLRRCASIGKGGAGNIGSDVESQSLIPFRGSKLAGMTCGEEAYYGVDEEAASGVESDVGGIGIRSGGRDSSTGPHLRARARLLRGCFEVESALHVIFQ